MNCFRSLYLWVDLQPTDINKAIESVVNCFRSLYLWVDLQPPAREVGGNMVVNCFRSLYLWVDLQLRWGGRSTTGGCELLSFFVPLG